ncbi:YTH domain-containing family 3 [Lecanosticta acicola]|uniref:YTH domain-containing family 3 n=1 Tax=Lecanosticta acicola TaxID=111012 RepID=A0AAI8Z7P9_9PEZI|nr:YTH domain-containing family 3 [Lecanosticta acicola]
MSNDTSSSGSTPTSLNYHPATHEFGTTATPMVTGQVHGATRRSTPHANSTNSSSPAPTSSGRRAARPPMALFSSKIWASPSHQPIRSAGLPPKSSWESFTDPRTSLHSAHESGSPTSFNSPHPEVASDSRYAISPLGSFDNNIDYAQSMNSHVASTSFTPGSKGLHFTQTEQYHNSNLRPGAAHQQGRSKMSHTDPLPQRPFAGAEQITEGCSSAGSSSSFHWKPGTPRSSASASARQLPGHQQQDLSSDSQQSPGSGSVALSDHYTRINPEQTGAKGDVWMERPNPHSLRRALQDPKADWSEAYPGSVTILTAMNPEAYQMPFGTRVVNIKTEFPENVLKSIQEGKYSVMEKIADRIMQVWNAREDPAEKVLFLFSINGSKKFCGIAEMSGPWDRNGSIKGWKDNQTALPSVGVFPVTWVFIKDVAYHQFSGIRQPHNHHSVGNMWNGMNFPSDIGRQVIETFVRSPATSSILGFPKNYPANFGLMPAGVDSYSGALARRGGFNPRGARGGRGFRGSYRGGSYRALGWRDQGGHYESQSDEERTPVPAKSKLLTDVKVEPPKIKSAPPAGVHFAPGELMTVTVDENGKFLFVAVGGEEHKNSVFPPRGDELISSNFTESHDSAAAHGGNSQVGVLGKRSFSSLHPSEPSASTLREQGRLVATAHYFDTNPDPNSLYSNASHSSCLDSGSGIRATGPGAYGAGEETPTHRPVPHGGRVSMMVDMQQSALVSPNGSPTKPLTEYQLKAKFHALAAEQYTLQDQLLVVTQSDMNVRLLHAKLARVLAEKREVLAQLSSMGVFGELETFSSIRHDSFSSADEASSSSPSGYDVRAKNGRRLRSISKLNSPERQQQAEFDKAPGGSGRQKGHQESDSGDWHVKKSITDLLKSPEKEAVPARPAIETSTFFPENLPSSATRNALSFNALDDKAEAKPGAFSASASFSFPRLGELGAVFEGQKKNFSFTGAGEQTDRKPSALGTPTSSRFAFGPPAQTSGSPNGVPKKNFSFTGPGKQSDKSPALRNSPSRAAGLGLQQQDDDVSDVTSDGDNEPKKNFSFHGPAGGVRLG